MPASWGQARRGGGQAAQDRWPGSREQGARGRGHRVQGNDDLLLLASLLLAGDVSRVALAIREGRRPIQRPCARLPIRYKHHVGIRVLRHVGAGQIRVRRPCDRVHPFRTAAFPPASQNSRFSECVFLSCQSPVMSFARLFTTAPPRRHAVVKSLSAELMTFRGAYGRFPQGTRTFHIQKTVPCGKSKNSPLW